MNYFKKNLLLPQNIGFHYADFADFLFHLDISRADLVNLTGKSDRSIRRYCNENNAPQWLYMVAYCAAGYLLSDTWSGWHLHRNSQGLIKKGSPSCIHNAITPQQIDALSLLYQHNRTLILKTDDLTRENDLMRNRLLIADHKRLVPDNVYPINKKISYEMISQQLNNERA